MNDNLTAKEAENAKDCSVFPAFYAVDGVTRPNSHHVELERRIRQVERRLGKHDEFLAGIIGLLREMMVRSTPPPRKVRRIGFQWEVGDAWIFRGLSALTEDDFSRQPHPRRGKGHHQCSLRQVDGKAGRAVGGAQTFLHPVLEAITGKHPEGCFEGDKS